MDEDNWISPSMSWVSQYCAGPYTAFLQSSRSGWCPPTRKPAETEDAFAVSTTRASGIRASQKSRAGLVASHWFGGSPTSYMISQSMKHLNSWRESINVYVAELWNECHSVESSLASRYPVTRDP